MRLAPVSALLLAIAASCDPGPAPHPTGTQAILSTGEGGWPMRVRLAGGAELEIPARPERILPAGTGPLDLLVALVGRERLAAVPRNAPQYSALYPRHPELAELPTFDDYLAEPLLQLAPDLIVTHTWQSQDTTRILLDNGIPVLNLSAPQGLADVLADIEFLGEILGAQERAAAVREDVERRVAALRASATRRSKLSAMTYSNTGAGGWTAGKGTTAAEIVTLAGLKNCAVDAGLEGNQRLNYERLLLLDPDVLVIGGLTEGATGAATEQVLRAEPLLAELSALKHDRVIVLGPAHIACPSQGIIDAAEALAAAVDTLP